MPEQFSLIDRLGRRMQVDTGSLPFALQKRISLFTEVLEEAQSLEEKKRILLTLLSLIAVEREKGWVCSDYAFKFNLGYEESRAFRVDIGSYLPVTETFNWAKMTKPILHYLQKNEELSLCDWWDEEIKKRT
jgi:hypothetical protein